MDRVYLNLRLFKTGFFLLQRDYRVFTKLNSWLLLCFFFPDKQNNKVNERWVDKATIKYLFFFCSRNRKSSERRLCNYHQTKHIVKKSIDITTTESYFSANALFLVISFFACSFLFFFFILFFFQFFFIILNSISFFYLITIYY